MLKWAIQCQQSWVAGGVVGGRTEAWGSVYWVIKWSPTLVKPYNQHKRAMFESPPRKKKLSLEDYEIVGKLGKGAYGEVFEALRKENSSKCALKQIQKKLLSREQKEYQALVERELLTRIDHPGVIKILASFQDPSSLYFCLELCEGGEFKRFLNLARGKLNQEAFRFYAAQIVNTLEYLHNHGIVHRDLKPQNIMVSESGHIKLIDFGTAEFSQSDLVAGSFKERIDSQKKAKEKKCPEDLEDTKDEESKNDQPDETRRVMRRSTFVGTSYYISPELLESNICEPPSDLWALGCCLYQFFYGKTPFSDCQEFLIFEKIKLVDYHFPLLPSGDPIPEDAKDLISRLLVRQPMERIGAKGFQLLKKHHFFDGLNVDKIFNQLPPKLGEVIASLEHQAEQKQIIDKQLTKSVTCSQLSSSGSQSATGSGSLIEGLVQKRSFLIYIDTYMALSSSGLITMSKPEKPQKRKILCLQENNDYPAELLEVNKFTVLTTEKKYVIKCENAETWVKKINEKAKVRNQG